MPELQYLKIKTKKGNVKLNERCLHLELVCKVFREDANISFFVDCSTFDTAMRESFLATKQGSSLTLIPLGRSF